MQTALAYIPRGIADLFGNGFAVKFVVGFPDLGNSESGDRESIEAERHLLLWYQNYWGAWCHLCLGIFTYDNMKSDEGIQETLKESIKKQKSK